MSEDVLYNYHLWHPRLSGQGALIVNVTPGEQASTPVASRTFMRDLLKTFSISAVPDRLEVLAYRSSYHAESDPDPDEWEDAWPLNWRITLFAAKAIEALPKLRHEYIGTLAFDPAGMDRRPPSKCACLVIADFESGAAADRCREEIAVAAPIAELKLSEQAPEPQFERVVVEESIVQEQINIGMFGRRFFQRGADYAIAFETICRSFGGITNFEERSSERDEFYDPSGIE